MARAHALEQSGRIGEAEAAFRALALGDPVRVDAGARYLRLLRRRDASAALTELREGLFKGVEHFDLQYAQAQLAVEADDPSLLRFAVERLLVSARTARDAHAIFPFIPLAFEGWEKTRILPSLDDRLAVPASAAGAESLATRDLARLRIRLALKDHNGFLARLDEVSSNLDVSWRSRFERLAASLRRVPFPDYSRPKVFGIGLSRTGTTSLTHTLDMLGFFSAHYRNEFTLEILTQDDAEIYDALTDAPVCHIFENLFFTYSNSMFIYTRRPTQSWVDSFNRHYTRYLGTSDLEALRKRHATPAQAMYGTARMRFAKPLYYQHASALDAHAAFERRVFSFFQGDRAKRLLVFDAGSGDGWEKLCGFLGKPVPNAPYPWENKG
jgi:hypothetical protein